MEKRKERMKTKLGEDMECKQKNVCIEMDGEEPVFILVLKKSKLGWKPEIA